MYSTSLPVKSNSIKKAVNLSLNNGISVNMTKTILPTPAPVLDHNTNQTAINWSNQS